MKKFLVSLMVYICFGTFFVSINTCIEPELPEIDIDSESYTPCTDPCYMTVEQMLCIVNNLDSCEYWDDVKCVSDVFVYCKWDIDIDLWIDEFNRRKNHK
jgi:hypothetical protein